MKKGFSRVLILTALLSLNLLAGTVKIWHGWTGQEKEAMLGLIARYEQLSGDNVEVLAVPFEALQGKYQAMAPQGQGPDVIVTPADWIGPFVDQNLLEPIDRFVAPEDKKAFMQNVLQACQFNGKLYALPESFKTIALIYNKDLVPEPPKTTDEMIEIGKEFTNEDESMYGLAYDKGNYYYHMPWIGGFGGTILDKDNNATFDSEAQIRAAEFVASLSQEPTKIMPEEVDYNVMMTLFQEGLASMIISGPWTVGDLMESGVNFGITRIPIVSETGRYPQPVVGPECLLMSSYSEDKDGAYKLIKYLSSAEAQAEMAKVGHLPSRAEVYDYRTVKKGKAFEYINGFRKQAEVGVPFPIVPEMAAGVWSNGGTFLSQVFSGDATAEEAGKDAQVSAMESINDMRNK